MQDQYIKPAFAYEPPSAKLIEVFAKKAISKETLERAKICHAVIKGPEDEAPRTYLKFPYFKANQAINVKYRSNTFSHMEDGAELAFYNFDAMDDDCTILVEGEFDVLTMIEVGMTNAIGTPMTAAPTDENYEDNFSYLLNAEKELTKVKKFVLAFSSTPSGACMEEEIARRLGKERCWRAAWPAGVRDANAMLVAHGKDALKAVIDAARPYPIKGIFEAQDAYDKIDALYTTGLPSGVKTGFASLDPHYTVKEGQWTLVTGIPGHGKSNFLDAMLVNIATAKNWKFGMFSPENQPIERHFANLMEKYADAPFALGAHNRMTEDEKNHAKQFVNDHFYVILPDEEEGNFSIDGILDLAKVLVFRKGIKGLVIDPWNELDHARDSGMTETEHISQALTKIRQFSRAYGVHVWVVAHPAKLYKDADGKYPVPTPYSVSGSSHWNNKADNALTIWRNRGGPDEDVCDIHVQKIRFKEIGRVGCVALRYKGSSGRFIDDINQRTRDEANATGVVLPTADLLRYTNVAADQAEDGHPFQQ
jgi:twinkle protein